MANGIFQLTGWLLKYQMQQSPDIGCDLAIELYFRCLEWYNSVFPLQSRSIAGVDGHSEHDDSHKDNENLQFSVFTQYAESVLAEVLLSGPLC